MKNSLQKIKINNISPSVLQTTFSSIALVDSKTVHFLNTYNLALAHRDRKYHGILAESDYNLVDGKLLQISLKKLYQKYVFHNRGTDLLRATISNLKTGKRHLFVCSSEESMSGLREVLEYRNEHLQVDLMVLPYSNDIDMLFKCVVRYIANRPFDFIWIGIGTPKQDVLANLLSKVQNGSFILCVGAALDFMAGTKKEAPTIMRNLGFEWLYRLSQEPRRLFKRYFFESWGFFSIVISRNIEIGDS